MGAGRTLKFSMTVSDSVHTSRYRALRRAAGEVPRLVSLVLAEADSPDLLAY